MYWHNAHRPGFYTHNWELQAPHSEPDQNLKKKTYIQRDTRGRSDTHIVFIFSSDISVSATNIVKKQLICC